MAQRSPRVTEMKDKTELSCMPGLFNILESRQSRSSPKMILNGGPVKKHVIDSVKKIEQPASFDEECRKIHFTIENEAALESVSADGSARSVGNLIGEDLSIENFKNNQIIVKGQTHTRTDSEILNHIMKTQKKAKKSSQKALSNAVFQPSSTSSELSFNKLTISAILGAVCDQNQHEENNHLSEGFQRGIYLGNHSRVDEMNMRLVQMSAKAFVDQMFIDRKFKEGTSSEYKPFSNALEVLNSNRDLFVDLLREPDSFLAKCIKNLQNSQRKKETIKSVLVSSESESKDGSDSEVSVSAMTIQRRKMNKLLWDDLNNQSQNSLRMNRSPNKIVILKPALENRKCSENVSCHCSSLSSHKRSGERSQSSKPASFKEKIKKKLKNTFGSNRNEPNRVLLDCSGEQRVSPNRGILGADETRKSFESLDNAKTNQKLWKKEHLKSNAGTDAASMNDTVRKKLDISSVKFPTKEEFDVMLEAKKHLSARLQNINAVESSTSKRSPNTLARILSSPERDFWPSPRRDTPVSAQMRFSPYGASTTATEGSWPYPNGNQRVCLSPLRQYKEIMTVGIDEQAKNTYIAAQGLKSNGEPKVVEINEILAEVSSETHSPEVSIPRQSSDTSETHEEDESILHSTIDSLSENETSPCTVEDFPSTPSSIYRLDMVDSIKYQEEHQSPVSVLEPFFSEDSNSPPSITLQTGSFAAGKQMKPRHLDFDACSFEPVSQDLPESCADEQDYISHYVHLVLKASCLSWEELSEIETPQETLVHESLFNEVEFESTQIQFDPKLLFDHINEVLLAIYQFQERSPLIKQKMRYVPLEKQVLDEIMREADFYLLPRTERRTLDQLVSKDVKGCRSWLDVRHDTEDIVVDISEDLLEESILDMLIEFHS